MSTCLVIVVQVHAFMISRKYVTPAAFSIFSTYFTFLRFHGDRQNARDMLVRPLQISEAGIKSRLQTFEYLWRPSMLLIRVPHRQAGLSSLVRRH